ncbi:PEBP-like protein [Lentinula aciculospora]|uniref:PEBP-like protein n=1 Tax=Lentinula aciculospora TaxID=153920 RepID=A0A9W9AMZ8_9AGAR|nr:PEBP-like protein [Lentinula aciculospora]
MALDPLSAVVTALKRESIIPDVIPEKPGFDPTVLFSIIYSGGTEAVLSTELSREDTLEEPEINFTPMVASDESAGDSTSSRGETSYTLVMTDPDAPSKADPKYRQFRHWVITGLQSPATSQNPSGTASLIALKTRASTTPYRPPGPPPGSGPHRYCFLLFQEPTGDSFTIPEGAKERGAALEERRSWNAFEFGTQYGLKLVGANYFIVKSVDV